MLIVSYVILSTLYHLLNLYLIISGSASKPEMKHEARVLKIGMNKQC